MPINANASVLYRFDGFNFFGGKVDVEEFFDFNDEKHEVDAINIEVNFYIGWRKDVASRDVSNPTNKVNDFVNSCHTNFEFQ